MGKLGYEINPEFEIRIIEDLKPAAEVAYANHMSSGPRKGLGLEDNPVAGVLDPLEEIYTAANLEKQDTITTELCDSVRNSFDEHIEDLEAKGLDIRTVINRTGLMNLGTEDNVSWYHAKQYLLYSGNPAYEDGLSRWTAEETTHGPLISMWGVNLTGAISSDEAHSNRVSLITGGIDVDVGSIVSTNAFTDPQEFDTFDAHKSLGSILDPIGRKVMYKVGGQETRHGRWFREIGVGIYELDQELVDYALVVEAETHRRFAMPAADSYPNFIDNAIQIAVNGLFTNEGVVDRQRKRVEALGLLEISANSDSAKRAQDRIAQTIDPASRINRMKDSMVNKATEKYISEEKEAGRVPFILGRTVVVENGSLQVLPEAA